MNKRLTIVFLIIFFGLSLWRQTITKFVINIDGIEFNKMIQQTIGENRTIFWNNLFEPERILYLDDPERTFSQRDSLSFGGENPSESKQLDFYNGLYSLAGNKLDDAILQFDRFRTSNEGIRPTERFILGAAYFKNGNVNQAISIWREDKSILSVLLLLGGDNFYRRKQPLLALSYYQLAIDTFPEECEPYYRSGMVYIELGRIEDASESLFVGYNKKCKSEIFGEIGYQLGKYLVADGDIESAINILQSSFGASYSETDIKKLLMLGSLLMNSSSDNYDLAYEYFSIAVKLNSKNYQSLVRMCELERRRMNFGEAIRFCNQTIDLDTENYEGYFRLGLINFDQGYYEEALKWFVLATEKPEYRYDVWNWIGETHYELGEYQQAIVAFEVAVDINGENIHARKRAREIRQEINIPERESE
jgi:tetratricopeptide (TPR) repeat protein